MTEDQIKHMTERFLSWRLPDNFNPDNGISFKQVIYAGMSPENQAAHWPVGTNLFGLTEAEEMVRHMLEGMPLSAQSYRAPVDAWLSTPEVSHTISVDLDMKGRHTALREAFLAGRASVSAAPHDARCFECDSELFGPICRACNPELFSPKPAESGSAAPAAG